MATIFQLIGEYSNALGRHGPDSPEVRRIREANATNGEFLGYADGLDRVKRKLGGKGMSDLQDLPSMLIRVKRLNYDTNYAYAPPQEDVVINLMDVQSVVETGARGIGPFVRVRFRDGSEMTCRGVPGDFMIGGELR